MSRALLVTLPGGGPGRGSSCEDCPFRAWEHLVERGDFGATSRMRALCTNPAFEADGLEGQARSLDAGRLAECIAAEATAAQFADVLSAARVWAAADAEDAIDEEGSPNLGEARRALHLAEVRAAGVPARDAALSTSAPSVPGLETIADVRRERAQALADLGDALAALSGVVKAWTDEAKQGDGVDEDHMPILEQALEILRRAGR